MNELIVYNRAYAAAQAGGMHSDESHEFAQDQAARHSMKIEIEIPTAARDLETSVPSVPVAP